MGLLRFIFKPVGCLFYALAALALALALGLAALLWALNHYAVPLTRHLLEAQTGYSIDCESARPNIWLGDFEATRLRVFNPARFGEPSFIECDRVYIDADPLSAVLAKTFLVHEADIEIARLHIVFDRTGENNVAAFLTACMPAPAETPAEPPPKPSPAQPPEAAAPATAEQTAPARWREIPADTAVQPPPPSWRIAKLRVAVKQVSVQWGDKPVAEWTLDYDRTFTQVTDWGDFLAQLRADVLEKALARFSFRDAEPAQAHPSPSP